MLIYTRWRLRRHYAHVNACLQFGLLQNKPAGWLVRRLLYDRLFRKNLRIAKLIHRHHHQL